MTDANLFLRHSNAMNGGKKTYQILASQVSFIEGIYPLQSQKNSCGWCLCTSLLFLHVVKSVLFRMY